MKSRMSNLLIQITSWVCLSDILTQNKHKIFQAIQNKEIEEQLEHIATVSYRVDAEERAHTGPKVERDPLWLDLDDIKLSLARALGAERSAHLDGCCAVWAFNKSDITTTLLQVLAQVTAWGQSSWHSKVLKKNNTPVNNHQTLN